MEKISGMENSPAKNNQVGDNQAVDTPIENAPPGNAQTGPQSPDLLVLTCDVAAFPPRLESWALELLDAEQRAAVLKSRRAADRIRRLAVRALLAVAGRRMAGLSPARTLGGLFFAQSGQPCLALPPGAPSLVPSFSHAENRCVCALAKSAACGAAGVDVEKIQPLKLEDYAPVFLPQELENIGAAQDPHSELIRLWTIKEAVLKAHGQGFLQDPATVCALNIPHFPPLPNLTMQQQKLTDSHGHAYWLTICAARPWKALLLEDVDWTREGI